LQAKEISPARIFVPLRPKVTHDRKPFFVPVVVVDEEAGASERFRQHNLLLLPGGMATFSSSVLDRIVPP